MSNCLRSLILITNAKSDCFITLLCNFFNQYNLCANYFCTIYRFSNDIEVVEVVLVDELQAESFINQLSNYDHIDTIELSDSEAQALLDQVKSQVLSYSDNTVLDFQLSFCAL